MFDTAIDVYKFIFMSEIIVSEAMFVYRFKRRKYFLLRLLAALVFCYLCTFLYLVPVYNAVYSSVMFLVLFAITLPSLKFCFDETWYNIFFCGIAAFTVQHLAYELFNYIGTVSGISEIFKNGIYGEESPEGINGYVIILYGGIYGTVYWIMFLLFGDRITSGDKPVFNGGTMLGLAALIVLVDVVLNMLATYRSYVRPDRVYRAIIFIFNVISCIMALFVQFGLLSRYNLKKELLKVYELRDRERQQYAMSQASIDLINRKCHDIKHQIRSLGKRQFLSEDTVKELEEEISIYDTSVKTGNAALDTILSEKKLYCKMNNISLTCMADGRKLDFINDESIYALFGNILDNAIEAVMKLDEEKRVIGLVVKQEKDILSVTCYNYFDSPIEFKDGLPVTSKGDTDYHGYGMRSIKTITEGYGGYLSINAKDNEFTINILFPLTEQKKNDMKTTVKEQEKRQFYVSRRKFLLFTVPPACILTYVSVGLMIVTNYYVFITG